MYVFSTLTALLAAAVLGRTVIHGRRVPLVLELPPYRMPDLRGTLRLMWERAAVFLREAGTIILVCTVALWALLSFPAAPTNAEPAGLAAHLTTHAVAAAGPHGASHDGPPTVANPSTPIEHTWGGRLGKALEPAIEPLGFDWRIGVGLVGAFAAREVFVSTMALIYGIEDTDDSAAPLRDRIRSETRADGSPRYTPLVGLSLLVFFALACQCMSTLAVVRRETRSWRWPAFMVAYMTGLAWTASFLVYQGGKLLGF
jgi:ferrous iron transport protein B